MLSWRGALVQSSLLEPEPVFIDPSGPMTEGGSRLEVPVSWKQGGCGQQRVLELVTLEVGQTVSAVGLVWSRTAEKLLPGAVFCAVDSRFQRVIPLTYLALELRTRHCLLCILGGQSEAARGWLGLHGGRLPGRESI